MNDADWRPVRGYEGLYEVSSRGELRRIKLGYKLTFDQVQEIFRLHETEGLGARPLARMFGVTAANIRTMFKGVHWKHRAPHRLIKQTPNTHGYPSIRICRDGKCQTVAIHRLVADAFLGPIQHSLEVNHKNGVKHDNRLENLELVTSGDNTRHAVAVLGRRLGAPHPGQRNPNSKLTDDAVIAIRARVASGERQADVARSFGVTRTVVCSVVHRRSWRHV